MGIKSQSSTFFLKGKFTYFLIVGISFVFAYYSIFDSKIDINGDNAGYYILAKSITTGQGYSNIHHLNVEPANHLPPGYPIIISAIFTLIGTKITTIKIVNGVFFFLSLLVLFELFIKISNNKYLSFATVLLILLNAHLLRFSTLMMSEIPFLFFSVLTMIVFISLDKNVNPFRDKKFYLFLLLLSFSFYIRTAGITLLCGIGFVLILKCQFRYLITTVFGFALLISPWQIRSQILGGNSYLNQLIQKNPYRPELGEMEFSDWITRFFANLKRYIVHEIPNGCFPNKIVDYQADIFATDWIVGLGLIALMLAGLFSLKNYRSIITGYLGGSMTILLFWPEVWYGVRFLIPIIPFLILLAGLGLLKLLEKFRVHFPKSNFILPCIWFLVVLYFIFPQLKTTKQLADLPYPMNYNNYFFIAKWAKTNTPQDALVCCRKDQLFYLFSNRRTVRYQNTLNKEDLIADLKDKKVDYVVLEQLGFLSTPRYLYPAIQQYQEKFIPVNHQKDPDTYLFRFRPELGYHGNWKNNLRHGKRTYYLLNGDSINGIWRNDSLVKKLNQ